MPYPVACAREASSCGHRLGRYQQLFVRHRGISFSESLTAKGLASPIVVSVLGILKGYKRRKNLDSSDHPKAEADLAAGSTAAAAWYDALRVRLRSAARGRTCREIGELTGTNAETVRRYLRTGRPCVRFLAAFCEAFELDLDWALFGRGRSTGHPDRERPLGRPRAAKAPLLEVVRTDKDGTIARMGASRSGLAD